MGATRIVTVCCIAAVLSLTACRRGRVSSTNKDHDQGFDAASAQVSRGAKVFANNCARCHGSSGEGGQGPQLVGPNALPLRREGARLRTGEFRTALDIAQFVVHNMPPSARARNKLTNEDYWAVLAYALSANGVILSEPVGPNHAANIPLH